MKDALRLGLHLFTPEFGVHLQQAQTVDLRDTGGLYLLRVGHGAPQHLIAAADAEDQRTGVGGLQDGRLQTGLPQPAQVGNGALGTRQQDHVRLVQVTHLIHIAQRHVSVMFEGAEIREIGDARHTDYRDIQELSLFGAVKPLGQAVFIVDVYVGVGDDPRHRDAAQLLQRLQSRLQNGPVAPEFVDHHALDAAALVLLQQCHRTVELGEHAAPVDVAYQQHRRVHQLGKAHIDDIILLEVDLRRAACPLNDDHVIL